MRQMVDRCNDRQEARVDGILGFFEKNWNDSSELPSTYECIVLKMKFANETAANTQQSLDECKRRWG